MNDTLQRIQHWYAHHCDGEWEHRNGLRIETIDNPGWHIEIDLTGTSLRQTSFDELTQQRTVTDWLQCRVRDQKFEAFCGPENLDEALQLFLSWVARSPA